MRRSRRLSLDELAPYLLEVPDPPRVLDWSQVFGNDRPVEIEVGCGKGLFLVTTSAAAPETNFVGIEIVRKYQLYCATRMAIRKHANVRMVCADAKLVLRDCVAAGSVQAIHVYFPDPWWKTRHHKRRVFTAEFVALCERAIQVGGRLHIATDVPEYFQVMTELLSGIATFAALPPPSDNTPVHDMDYMTNFERKARKIGKPIHRAVYERLAVGPL